MSCTASDASAGVCFSYNWPYTGAPASDVSSTMNVALTGYEWLSATGGGSDGTTDDYDTTEINLFEITLYADGSAWSAFKD